MLSKPHPKATAPVVASLSDVHDASVADARSLDGWRAADHRRIFLQGLELDARIGVHPHEREAPQPIVISIELAVRPWSEGTQPVFMPPPREGDAVAREIVCYESLTRAITDIACSGHIDYVETLAAQVAETCLGDDRVTRVIVRIEKPSAIASARSAGVEIERVRA